MIAVLLVLYVFACVTVGLLGRDTTLGVFGSSVAALLLTPFLVLLLILMFRPSRRLRELMVRTHPRGPNA